LRGDATHVVTVAVARQEQAELIREGELEHAVTYVGNAVVAVLIAVV
jgi:hypothetical protein